jgi:hypothetical protein
MVEVERLDGGRINPFYVKNLEKSARNGAGSGLSEEE